ncbi:MAG: phosphate ABC transporter permease PstA [Alphaproteobacteria bacterium]
MTDTVARTPAAAPQRRPDLSMRRLSRRYAAERRFRLYGLAAILFAFLVLVFLVVEIVRTGAGAFTTTEIGIDVPFTAETIDPTGARDPEVLADANYRQVVLDALTRQFPHVAARRDRQALMAMLSGNADFRLRGMVLDDPAIIGTTQRVWFKSSADIDVMHKAGEIDETAFVPAGIASPIGTTGTVKVLVSSNAFAGVLADVKGRLTHRADRLDAELAGEERRRAAGVARLGAARRSGDATQAQDAEALVAAADAAIDRLREQIDDLHNRISHPGGTEPLTADMPSYLLEINGGVIKLTSVSPTEVEGDVLMPLASEAEAASGSWRIVGYAPPETDRRVNDRQLAWYHSLEAQDQVRSTFNTTFFSAADSREPELAGVRGAVVGSILTLLVCLILSFPLGVMAAIYLEEFAPKNRWTDLIEVNINNLAAVPSIVFGLLGLAVLLGFFGMPRSAPVAGGTVLALMTLPTIIIAARAALKAVPPSIREAALGMGASPLQTVLHHVLPLAMPGILTGTIIGMAQALGETAPLLMIGMVAFIVDVPDGFTDAATVLPVQIFLWADAPERAFVEKTSAAIIVLLVFLILMNLAAVILRKRFERRW